MTIKKFYFDNGPMKNVDKISRLKNIWCKLITVVQTFYKKYWNKHISLIWTIELYKKMSKAKHLFADCDNFEIQFHLSKFLESYLTNGITPFALHRSCFLEYYYVVKQDWKFNFTKSQWKKWDSVG